MTAARHEATYDLSSSTALVTGAAGAFGRAVAVRLARSGARVALADLASSHEALEATLEECRAVQDPKLLMAVPFDVTDPVATDSAFAAVAEPFGVPDLVFNNAGYQGVFASTGDYPVADLRRVLEVNVVGVVNVLQSAARALQAGGSGGSVVNSASMAGVGGAANMPAYAASKGAVISLTKAAALDLAEHGIRVNAISPAFIGPGDMWDRQVRMQADVASQYYADDPAVVAEQMVGHVPLRRMGSVDEVASTVLWLLSGESSYVTGENILISGGILS